MIFWSEFWSEEDIIDWGKNTGTETRKTWMEKYKSGFFHEYMSGKGIDIGYQGYTKEEIVPVLPSAIGIDLGTPEYDGHTLPFKDGELDYAYSSHFLEHVDDYAHHIREQFRVVKSGGHIVIVVPHKFLYEKKESLPSRWNADHRRMYTPASLLLEIENSLPPNSFRVRHLRDNDKNHDYNQPNDEHSKGEYEIEVVIQKL